jgi:hypothetical protein
MTLDDISIYRLLSQQVAVSSFKTARDLVGWMGAMQAQDYNMAKWAVGVRVPGSTDKIIEAAIDKGEILRTHLLRPTWHLVSADDIYWMLELTAPHIKASTKSRWKQLELSEAVINKSNKVIEKALTGGKHLSREELISKLEKAKIATNDQRAAHIMLAAELDRVVCSGATKQKKQTYALLAERVTYRKKFSKDEALAELAKKYFTSHGPATLQDFTWWSGLSVTNAKNALEMIRSGFISEKVGTQTFWISDSFSFPKSFKESVYLLPAYDEFIISYRDRSASVLFKEKATMISNNGIFRPVIVINGKVNGIWKRIRKKDKTIIETQFFKSTGKVSKNLIEKSVGSFGDFLNQKAEIMDHVL